MQYKNIAHSITYVSTSAVITALCMAAATAGTLGTLNGTEVTTEDVAALFSRNGQKPEEQARFANIDQGKELVRTLMLVLRARLVGADQIGATAEERAHLRIVGAKATLDHLLEISDKRVDEAARRDPAMYTERIKEVYETATQQFIAPKKAKAAHILIRAEKRTVTEAAQLADQIVARARAGESFEALAKQYSDDERTRDRGGVLGEYSDSKKGDHPIEIAAFWTKREKDIAEPVLGRSGIHVVKILSETPASRASLTEAEPHIRLALIAQKKVLERSKWSQVFNEAVEKTTYNDAEIKKLVAATTGVDREKMEAALKLLGIGTKPNDNQKP